VRALVRQLQVLIADELTAMHDASCPGPPVTGTCTPESHQDAGP
jgi:hypothetical protein